MAGILTEDLHLFKIVSDCGFQSLMKTGHPEYYIPSPSTVSHDVQLVFANACNRIVKMLQVCHYMKSLQKFR